MSSSSNRNRASIATESELAIGPLYADGLAGLTTDSSPAEELETIDQDTRLSTADDTKAIWRPRPSGKVGRIGRTKSTEKPSRKKPVYRGEEKTSHSRQDVLTGSWTIYAPARDERPNEFASLVSLQQTVEENQPTPKVQPVDPDCPFCSGAELQTPPAVWSARIADPVDKPGQEAIPPTKRLAGPRAEIVRGDQPDWGIRVIPNKYPAVSQFEDFSAAKAENEPLFPLADVVGGHEVVIECDQHAKSMTEATPSSVYLTLLAYRDRVRHWANVPGVRYISVFKNCGLEAGASLRHTHSQLIATSLMPNAARNELLRCEMHRAKTGCSLGCDLIRAEISERSRVIDQSDSFIAFCPFASRFPGMLRISSTAHRPHFHTMDDELLDQLSSFLWRAIHWVEDCFPGKSYNYILRTCPPGAEMPDAFQWSLDIFPRLTKAAGFEWSSDCMINSQLPEKAASEYRRIASKDDPRNLLAFG
ncbi:MAG: DUF4921 family protein [Planctomycetota bacterium]